MAIDSPAAADVLVGELQSMLRIVYTPLSDVVARLDTTGRQWVLFLDSDSPTEDQCWAMLDVLRVLVQGSGATAWAIPAPRLRSILS